MIICQTEKLLRRCVFFFLFYLISSLFFLFLFLLFTEKRQFFFFFFFIKTLAVFQFFPKCFYDTYRYVRNIDQRVSNYYTFGVAHCRYSISRKTYTRFNRYILLIRGLQWFPLTLGAVVSLLPLCCCPLKTNDCTAFIMKNEKSTWKWCARLDCRRIVSRMRWNTVIGALPLFKTSKYHNFSNV